MFEKRLLTDITAIREAYTNGDLTNVALVASKFNLADAFTKADADKNMLREQLKTEKLTHSINQQIILQE